MSDTAPQTEQDREEAFLVSILDALTVNDDAEYDRLCAENPQMAAKYTGLREALNNLASALKHYGDSDPEYVRITAAQLERIGRAPNPALHSAIAPKTRLLSSAPLIYSAT